MIEIFIPLKKIPSATAQEKGCRIVKGKIVHYEKDKVREVRQLYQSYLCHHIPEKPIDGAVGVAVTFVYHTTNTKRLMGCGYVYKSTKPDVDNLAKLLLDVMTECGYWQDDGQVANLNLSKFWAENVAICGVHIRIDDAMVGCDNG